MIKAADLSATVGAALARSTAILKASGSPSARLDAEVLLAHVEQRDRTWLLAHPEAPVIDAAGFEAVLERRAAGEPIAYIRGWKEWHSLRIKTDPRALIPRPETELLADATITEIAARLVRDEAPIVAWEVATGSGAVAVVLALRFRQELALGRLSLIASDVSPDALELARENLATHDVERFVNLSCGDLLDAAGGPMPRPDVIAANLPYVPTVDVKAAAGSLAHEPHLALDGGPDGLDLLRRLIGELPERAAPGATVLLEIGAGQAPAVRNLTPAGASVWFEADLAGVERIAHIRLSDSDS